MEKVEQLYRYVELHHNGYSALWCYDFEVRKETLKGWRIENGKWISKTSIKKYAYPTKLEALNNFIKRKERQIELLNFRLKEAKSALCLAKPYFQSGDLEALEKDNQYNHHITKNYGEQ